MKLIAFICPSVGPSLQAIQIINLIDLHSDYRAVFISLTESAARTIQNFSSPILLEKYQIGAVLGNQDLNSFPESLTEAQLQAFNVFISQHDIMKIFTAVPSESISSPMQVAAAAQVPVLFSYEHLFRPNDHPLWSLLGSLDQASITIACPLKAALADFFIEHPDGQKQQLNTAVVGHLVIDAARNPLQLESEFVAQIKTKLLLGPEDSLALFCGSSQALNRDADFLIELLDDLKNHPAIQLRFAIHPGVKDFENYCLDLLRKIQVLFIRDPASIRQFKIILPQVLQLKLGKPDRCLWLTDFVLDPKLDELFLLEDLKGDDVYLLADKIAQAVPGALVNRGILEGKTVYSDAKTSYLPQRFFAASVASFYQDRNDSRPSLKALNLSEETSSQACLNLLMTI